MLSARSWILRKIETIVEKDLACFLPHMSAALSSFIALQSEAGLGFAIEAEYHPKGSWNACSLAFLSWLWMDALLSHSYCVPEELLCLVVMDPRGWLSERKPLFLLFTWVVKEKYRLLKSFSCSHVYSHTNHTTGGKLHLADVATVLWALIREHSNPLWTNRTCVELDVSFKHRG